MKRFIFNAGIMPLTDLLKYVIHRTWRQGGYLQAEVLPFSRTVSGVF